jgi:hypothetical protein
LEVVILRHRAKVGLAKVSVGFGNGVAKVLLRVTRGITSGQVALALPTQTLLGPLLGPEKVAEVIEGPVRRKATTHPSAISVSEEPFE